MSSWCFICNNKNNSKYVWFKGEKVHKKCMASYKKKHMGTPFSKKSEAENDLKNIVN